MLTNRELKLRLPINHYNRSIVNLIPMGYYYPDSFDITSLFPIQQKSENQFVVHSKLNEKIDFLRKSKIDQIETVWSDFIADLNGCFKNFSFKDQTTLSENSFVAATILDKLEFDSGFIVQLFYIRVSWLFPYFTSYIRTECSLKFQNKLPVYFYSPMDSTSFTADTKFSGIQTFTEERFKFHYMHPDFFTSYLFNDSDGHMMSKTLFDVLFINI